MASSIPVPRKQRTREHVLADLSLNHVERVMLDAGHTTLRVSQNYGYDLLLFTYDDQGYAEPGVAFIQLKASEALTQSGAHYVYDLDIKDYNLWTAEHDPIFLVLFDATRRRAYWLHVQAYFRGDASRRPKERAKTVQVRVPRREAVSRSGVAKMRELKQIAVLRLMTEGQS